MVGGPAARSKTADQDPREYGGQVAVEGLATAGGRATLGGRDTPGGQATAA